MSNKILAFTIFDNNFSSLKNLVVKRNAEYFKKYNTEYTVYDDDAKDLFNVNWNKGSYINYYIKFLLLEKFLNSNDYNDIDYFFMMDCDIVICNLDLDLDIFIRMSCDKDILICSTENCSEDMFWNVNTGSILFKNSQNTKTFINNYLEIAKKYAFQIYDQPLMQAMIRQDPSIKDLFCVFPRNSFNHGNKDSFLFHACVNSTSNQNFQEAINKKEQDIIEVLKNL